MKLRLFAFSLDLDLDLLWPGADGGFRVGCGVR
jgi:hypothetical protein